MELSRLARKDTAVSDRGGDARRVRVGCSGWQYKHWRGDFYPAELPSARWFEHYARAFDTVEINNSFYRWPAAETFAKWREQAPAGFVYAVKASRFLTHMKKLKDPEEPVLRTFEGVTQLGPHLGPVLYQLPPRWPVNIERFERFMHAISKPPKRLRQVVEFRHPSWYTDDVFALLRTHGVALCLHDMHGSGTGMTELAPFVYVRFHFGTQKYGGRYEDARLEEWADWLADRARRGVPVFAYFNNDVGGHAPRDAVRLRERVLARLTSSSPAR